MVTVETVQDSSGLDPTKTLSGFLEDGRPSFAGSICRVVAARPGWSHNPLFLFGPEGVGKSHLLHGVGNEIQALLPKGRVVCVTAQSLAYELAQARQDKTHGAFQERFRLCDALLIDDIEEVVGLMATQEEIFHAFNQLHSRECQIVITGKRHPRDIPGLESRLVSRFEWGMVADVQPPGTQRKVVILRSWAQQEEVSLPPEVALFLARRSGSDVRQLKAWFQRLVAMSRFETKPITLEFAHEHLRVEVHGAPAVVAEHVMRGVADFFEVTISDLKGPRRTKRMVEPRQIAMALIRFNTDRSLPSIGELFGGRDHTTVIHAVRKIQGSVTEKPELHVKFLAAARHLGLLTGTPKV